MRLAYKLRIVNFKCTHRHAKRYLGLMPRNGDVFQDTFAIFIAMAVDRKLCRVRIVRIDFQFLNRRMRICE